MTTHNTLGDTNVETNSTNKPWNKILTICSILLLSIVVIVLCFICADLYGKICHKNHERTLETVQVYEDPEEKLKLIDAVHSIKESALQISIDTVNTDLSGKILDLEIASSEFKETVSRLEKDTLVLSDKVSNLDNELERTKSDSTVKDKATNDRIDSLIKDFQGFADDLKSLRAETKESLNALSSRLEESRMIMDSQSSKIDENGRQIEDVKLMFYNYDTVLAMRKLQNKK